MGNQHERVKKILTTIRQADGPCCHYCGFKTIRKGQGFGSVQRMFEHEGAVVIPEAREWSPVKARRETFDHVKPNMKIYKEEIFGPVAAITAIGSDDEAVQLANHNEYGLSAGVFSADVGRAILHIGRHIAGADHDDAHAVAVGRQDELARGLGVVEHFDAGALQQRQGLVEDAAFGEGECDHLILSMSAPMARSLASIWS